MSDLPVVGNHQGSSSKTATWIGLFIAFFGMLIARQAVSYFYPTVTVIGAVWKESLMWLCVIFLFLIIRRGEHLSLRSVGIGNSAPMKSVLWSLPLAVVCSSGWRSSRRHHSLWSQRKRGGIREAPGLAAFTNLCARRFRRRIIFSRLRHRTTGSVRLEPFLGGRDSAGGFRGWSLDGWLGQHCDRTCNWSCLVGFLSLAPRSGHEHDRPFPGRFCGKRFTKTIFPLRLTRTEKLTVGGVAKSRSGSIVLPDLDLFGFVFHHHAERLELAAGGFRVFQIVKQ